MVNVFDVYKNSGIIDGFGGTEIDISKEKGWKEEIIIKNCPNLTSIDCSNLGSDLEKLKKITIENCSNLTYLDASNNYIKEVNLSKGNDKLETIFLSNNQLTNFDALDFPCESIKKLDINANQMACADLTECKNLEILNCGVNKLSSLDLSGCPRLIKLYCYKNSIKSLQVKKLKNLEELYCQSNLLEELDCSGLKELKELYCFCNTFVENDKKFFGLKKLSVKGCESLEELDCAENSLEKLELDNHSKLDTLSCKENCLLNLMIKKCPNLIYLDFSLQGFFELVEEVRKECCEEIPSKLFIDTKSRTNIQQFYYTKDSEFIKFAGKKSNSSVFLTKEDFPNAKRFEQSFGEIPCFDEHLDEKERKKLKRENSKSPSPDQEQSFDASNYQIPSFKDEVRDHDISHWNLTGELIIDGWEKLKSLNVGNNELNKLVVRNCPNLKRLIYSHNKMSKEAEIENCPNLVKIDKENYNGGIEWKEELSEAEKARIELQKIEERNNSEIYSILKRDENGEDISLEELAKILAEINPSLLKESEYFNQLLILYNKKLREKFPQFYEDKKEKEDNSKPDYEKLYFELLEKIKNGEITLKDKEIITNSLLSEEKKQELYKLLAEKNQTISDNNPTNSKVVPIIYLASLFIFLMLASYEVLTKKKKKSKII